MWDLVSKDSRLISFVLASSRKEVKQIMVKEDLTDEELLYLIKCGSESAYLAFYERYRLKSVQLARYYSKIFTYRTGVSYEEFFELAFYLLPDLIAKVDEIISSFEAYWRRSARNAIFDFLRTRSEERRNIVAIEDAVSDGEHFSSPREVNEISLYSEDLRIFLKEKIFHNSSYKFTKEEKEMARYIFFSDCSVKEAIEKLGWKRNHGLYVAHTLRQKVIKILKESYF